MPTRRSTARPYADRVKLLITAERLFPGEVELIHLPQRREAAPGDHRRGDDAAHGHLLLLDFIDADDDDGNRYQLLHGRDEADGEG